MHFKIEHGHEKHELMVFGAFPSNQPNEQPLMIVCVWFRLLRMGLVLGFTPGLDAMRWDGRMKQWLPSNCAVNSCDVFM